MNIFENLSLYFRIALLLVGVVQPCKSYTKDSHLELADILPKDVKYDKFAPPFVYKGRNDYDPTIIRMLVTILGINSIDEALMTFSVDIYFAQIWQDLRLDFPNNTDKNRMYDVEWLNHFWRPDTYFRNAKSIQLQTLCVSNHYLELYENKTIKYTMKVALELTCSMDFAFYPHDTQKCVIRIESLNHRTSDLVFEWYDDIWQLAMERNIQLPQLTLTETYLANCTYGFVDGTWPCLEVVFKLKRIMGYYLINSYIPTCLIVIISWISFWIKPDAVAARVTLGVTSLLTLLTQHSKSQESLPRVAYLKMVDAFMLTSTVFVFMVLIEFCLVIIIVDTFKLRRAAKKRQIARRMPTSSFCIWRRLPFVSQHRRINSFSISNIESAVPCDSVSLSNARLDPILSDDWMQRALLVDRISRILFPTSFVLLNLVYWVIALSSE